MGEVNIKQSGNKWSPLHLFLYHKDDDATRNNFEQLCHVEGRDNVQPISDCRSYLNGTFRADRGKWSFPHWDSYWMCDGLIYKYVLENIDRVLSSSAVCINEYDTWWQMCSQSWMPELISKADISGSNLLQFGRSGWTFFEKHKHLDFASQLCGLVPFSVICVKPSVMVSIAERVRDDNRLHPLYNNEMRIGTAANLIGAKMQPLPHHVGKNIQWHHCHYSQEPGIYHPIKQVIKSVSSNTKYSSKLKSPPKRRAVKKSKVGSGEFAVITGAFYGEPQRCFEASRRLRASVERFDRELVVIDGSPPRTMQEMKNHLIVPKLKDMDHEWVMWLDCTDVYCAQDPYLAVKYADKCGSEILVSAEGNCWPEPHFSTQFKPPPYSFNGIDYRYLCAGVCMGRRKNFIRHMEIMQDMYIKDKELMEPWRTDQATWHRMFLNQDKLGASVQLDYQCNMVVSTCNVPMDNFVQSSRSGKPCIKMAPTGGKPIILHFNGNDKHNTKKINTLISMTDITGYEDGINKPYRPASEIRDFRRRIIKIEDAVTVLVTENKFKRTISFMDKDVAKPYGAGMKFKRIISSI
jgi:hypothetical protein